MTQEQFNKMLDNYFAEVAKRDGSPWSADARDWAVDNGVFKGDGSGNFNWQSPVTREQLASVLRKL
ncbi:hypothetical protein FACS18949_11740 [Clostridia bacterium]|nr:hypothetical protein FACS189425_09220 [Clostridia bacterium]GHV34885.1 hypothetical protein FACS18949_11740 [Clostridia bacterium]